ncbi:MAG TPA: hypothetical protein VHV77_05975 [Pirellulales bacterium]|jgi:hypothetical protein|nr:hypothetical protein [Pirellulales bacterium]
MQWFGSCVELFPRGGKIRHAAIHASSLATCCVAALVSVVSCAPAQQPGDPAATQPPLMAREYEEFPQKDVIKLNEFKSLRFKVMRMCQAGVFQSPEEQQDFIKYFKYKVAELTWLANIPDLPKKIADLKKQDLYPSGRAPEQNVHDQLTQLLLTALPNFAANEKYHPACRESCILLLGNLDQVEPDGLGNNAVPLPAALDKLLDLVVDPKLVDGLRVAAMTGISRHARAGIAPLLRVKTVKTLTSPIPMGNNAGTVWMKYSAARCLGGMATKWPEANKPEVIALAKQLIEDAEASLTIRCDGALVLGCVDKAGYAGAQVAQLASSAGLLAAELGKSATDPNYKWDENDKLVYLTNRLLCVQTAIKGVDNNRGLQAAAGNEAKPFVTELLGKVADLVDSSANNKLQLSDAQSRLAQKGQALEQWIKSKGNGDGNVVAADGR